MNLFNRQRGLSLIELMIGILLSALLLMGVLQIFDGNRNIMRMQNEFARVQESGRFAMDLLLQEIRMADFWGCLPPSSSIRNHLDPGDADYGAGFDDVYGALTGSNGIGGENNATNGKTIGTLTVKSGTDMLILGGTEDACRGRGNMVPSVNAQAMHVSPNCAVEPGQIVLIGNCELGELMTITSVQGKGGCTGGGGGGGNNEPEKLTITHNSGNCNKPGAINNLNLPLQTQYGADARILTPYLRTFFVGENEFGTSLYVSESGVGTQELVPRIENMQILYGADTDGDDAVDFWGSADDVVDMKQVLNIRVQLMVASGNPVQADDLEFFDLDDTKWEYTDGKLRKIYLSSAKVRNRGAM
ncbi:type IV pilus assembly protein PilW [Microbulbifer donghaiensis]|uniref:Type IV pilus assembly protein PilW n=1 Tax=Microbulbifer donghaiensis TaxID=494016 RepID=A0A1M5HW08_9GAMM|nr:PilW family protein [Microbulbifer donghaiensis]SHG20117.1 type IV pilus assembly protein PilW [Microbulbifer donghaiensis]